ncbi:MAG: ABC transporter substrate-binding protein [Methanothrix sp.]
MRGFAILGVILSFIFVIVLTAVFPCMASDQAVSAKDLTYITEQFPPFNFKEDDNLQGISVDLLEMVWQRMGEDLNRSVIQVLPWTEGYNRTLEEDNTVLFTVGRVPEREQLFKWAGPIGSSWYVMLTKMEKNISITDPEDLKKLKIGAVQDDLAIQLLLDKGIKKDDMVIETTSEPIVEMLKDGSIDAWVYNDLTAIWQLQKSGENSSDYTVAYVFGSSDGYLAFNKGVPDSLVQSFQEAIDYIKTKDDRDGASDYEKILIKYTPGINQL